MGLLLKKNESYEDYDKAAEMVGSQGKDIHLQDGDLNRKLVVTFESQDLLHGSRHPSAVSPTNFSHLELK